MNSFTSIDFFLNETLEDLVEWLKLISAACDNQKKN